MKNFQMAWRGTCLAIFLILLSAAPTAAQTSLGRMSGTVLDSSGAVLPGATITMTSDQTGQVQSTTSTETGAFLFPLVPVGTYKVEIELQGFKSATFTKVSVAVAQEYSLTARLELGNVSENVTVEAGASLVPTTSPEVTTTVGQGQIVSLPLNGRNPISLVQLQAGVASLGRTNTAINGGRPTWTQVTQDGINIQDNFIRTNSVDFVPNRPTSDNVGEFSIVTTAQGADNASGASQVRMITPAGTNSIRGNAYEYNRHSDFAANTFFNKRSNLPVSYLNRNQFGGSVGGPLRKNKLFFYANYEAFRQEQQVAQNYVIPVRSDLLTGNFRYFVAADGSVRNANVLQLAGLTIDPAVQSQILSLYPGPENVNSYDSGDSRADRILNTARYRFLQQDLNDRNQWVTRGDYALSTNHHFEVIYSYIKETDDRTDLDEVTPTRPLVFTDSHAHRYVGSWRWTASSRLQNELRIGGNLAPVDFKSDVDFSSGVLLNVPGIASLGSPLVNFQPQGRNTRTYQYSDSANLMLGNHALQFGGSAEQIRVNAYNFAARFPTVTFGLSSAAPAGLALTAAQLPGIAAADLTSANNLLSMLSGSISQLAQTFQVESQTSGFVGGIPNDRNWSLDNYSLYIQDNWRWKPNVTIRAGVKWEYFSPVSEDNNLAFVPVLNNGQTVADAMMNPATTVSFSNGGMWNNDLNNFGPTLGITWDPFKDGKTSVRAGYTLTFVNEEGVTVGTGVGANAGLSTAVTVPNLYQRLSAGKPVIATPAVQEHADDGRSDRGQQYVGHPRHGRGRQAAARPPVQRGDQPRDHVEHGVRGSLRRHARARHLARRRSQSARRHRRPRRCIRGRLPARSPERVSGAGRRRRVRAGLQPQHSRQPGPHRASTVRAARRGRRQDRDSAERAGATRRPLHDDGRRDGRRARSVPAQRRHLRVGVRQQHLVPGLRRAPDGAAASVPERHLRPDQLHVQQDDVRLDRQCEPEPHRAVPRQRPAGARRGLLDLPQRPCHQRQRRVRAAVRRRQAVAERRLQRRHLRRVAAGDDRQVAERRAAVVLRHARHVQPRRPFRAARPR